MTIPQLPTFFKMKYTEASGHLTSQANTFNDVTFQILNQLVNAVNTTSGSGYLLPPGATTVQITQSLAEAPNGAIWYNTDTGQWQGKVGGVLKTFTVT